MLWKQGRSHSRVLLIGADGVDPVILHGLIEGGRLPALQRMARMGSVGELGTTYPPVSPVAWTSVLTGCWPARHGVIDFVTKAAGSYHPTLGLYSMEPDRTGVCQYRSRRSRPTLADYLSRNGRVSYLLHVPATFPAWEIKGGMLSGLGTPDLAGTFGVSALYTTELEALSVGVRGRREVALLSPLSEDCWSGCVCGPPGCATSFTVSRRSDGVRLILDGTAVSLKTNEWTQWLPVRFSDDVGSRLAVHGICRFCLLRADEGLLLYRTPLHHAPIAPSVPLCWPRDFSSSLVGRLGDFPTASYPMDQAALQDGLLPPHAFLTSAYQMWDQQLMLAETLLREQSWSFLMTHFFVADSLQHFFWPDIEGEIARGYVWLDQAVGRLQEAAGDGVVTMVASDHGVMPVEHWVHLNRWLQIEGFLAADDDGRIDWRGTKAFCLGYGGIYLNVAGREPRGIVEPGRHYQQIRGELAARLRALRSQDETTSVVAIAQPREAWHRGPHVVEMPDLMVGLSPGFALAREDARGHLPACTDVLEPNHGRWRAGHEGPYMPEHVPGVLLAAGPGIKAERLFGSQVVDLAPTIMDILGVTPAWDIDGKTLLYR